jgi:DNA-binding NtrC family response regulator
MDLQSIKNRFGIIGNDAQLNYALQVAEQVANTDLSVLIFGESGVGKEVFSQIIHNLSARKHNAFIAVNCGAIPEGTIDSELFGHEKGSFTSASEQRKGYFETVNGGTIFLDEIGEMPLGTQARLLRVLETGEYIRVGSSKVHKTNVRVIAATNKDLLTLTTQGKFREDLYYRLNTVPIRVPALRERKEDIPMLFRKFAGDFAERYKTQPVQLDDNARQAIMQYTWPGNIRELKNIAEQISVLSKNKMVSADDIVTFLPKSPNNRMPALTNAGFNMPTPSHTAQQQDQPMSSTEREILYKLFFDLKKDINDLKKMIIELAHHQGMTGNSSSSASMNSEHLLIPSLYEANTKDSNFNTTPTITNYSSDNNTNSNPALIIHHPVDGNKINDHEDVEESLSLIDREKEFIVKALQKHKGKRKDAAQELGISERTLYRKIKEYDIEG